MSLTRGRVVRVDIGAKDGLKPVLIVSNNRRNTALNTALAVRLTTSEKPAIPSVVEMSQADPFVGRALCDDVLLVYADEVLADLGAITRATMARVEDGLRHALGLAGER